MSHHTLQGRTDNELLWFQRIDIIKGMSEAVIVFIRKPCDQVQMLMNISETVYPVNNSLQFLEIHSSVDCLDRVRIHDVLHYRLQHEPV